MLWGIIVVLFVLWALGFGYHVGGDLIHLVIVVAVILLIYNVFFYGGGVGRWGGPRRPGPPRA